MLDLSTVFLFFSVTCSPSNPPPLATLLCTHPCNPPPHTHTAFPPPSPPAIQANMDPKHRDKVAFVRVVSGEWAAGAGRANYSGCLDAIDSVPFHSYLTYPATSPVSSSGLLDEARQLTHINARQPNQTSSPLVHTYSGKFEKGMKVRVARSGRTVTLAAPQRMFANERQTVQEGFAGDVIGLTNPGAFAIGASRASLDAAPVSCRVLLCCVVLWCGMLWALQPASARCYAQHEQRTSLTAAPRPLPHHTTPHLTSPPLSPMPPGDTLVTGPTLAFPPIPTFSPELFAYLRCPPNQKKPFLKGVEGEIAGERAGEGWSGVEVESE